MPYPDWVHLWRNMGTVVRVVKTLHISHGMLPRNNKTERPRHTNYSTTASPSSSLTQANSTDRFSVTFNGRNDPSAAAAVRTWMKTRLPLPSRAAVYVANVNLDLCGQRQPRRVTHGAAHYAAYIGRAEQHRSVI